MPEIDGRKYMQDNWDHDPNYLINKVKTATSKDTSNFDHVVRWLKQGLEADAPATIPLPNGKFTQSQVPYNNFPEWFGDNYMKQAPRKLPPDLENMLLEISSGAGYAGGQRLPAGVDQSLNATTRLKPYSAINEALGKAGEWPLWKPVQQSASFLTGLGKILGGTMNAVDFANYLPQGIFPDKNLDWQSPMQYFMQHGTLPNPDGTING